MVSLLELLFGPAHAYVLGIWGVMDFLTRAETELKKAIEENDGRDFLMPPFGINEFGIGNLTSEVTRVKAVVDYARALDIPLSSCRERCLPLTGSVATG